MNNDLIDQSLKTLLETPHSDRSAETIASWLSFITEVSGIALFEKSTTQREHLLLAPAAHLLAEKYGGKLNRTWQRISLEPTHLKALTAVIELPGIEEPFYGFGETAEETLASLRKHIEQHQNEAVQG